MTNSFISDKDEFTGYMANSFILGKKNREDCGEIMNKKIKHIVMGITILASIIAIPDGQATPIDSRSSRILFVFSWHKDMPWQREIEEGFRKSVNEKGLKSDLFYEYMDAGRFKNKNHIEMFKKYLSEKYVDHKIDYVIYESLAATKLFKLYPELFKHSRKIIVNPALGVLNDFDHDASTIIPVSADYEGAVNYLAQVSPGNPIYLVAGTTNGSKERGKKFEALFARLAPDKHVIPLVGLPMAQLLDQVSRLEAGSIILYLLIFQDGEGTRFIPYDVARQISQKASVPVYSLWTSLMGSGILGGYLLSGERVGQEIATVLIDPEGFQRADVENHSNKFHGFFFDWTQLKRWHIDEDHLPPNSKIEFQQPTFIEQYAHELTVGLLASIILLSLFWNRRLKKEIIERHKADQRLRESESKYRSLSDAAFEGIAISYKGKILDVNKALAHMFGYSTSELIGMNALNLISQNDHHVVQKKIMIDEEGEYEIRALSKSGKEFPVAVHGKMFPDGKRQVRVTAVRDLTKQKEAERERKNLFRQLQTVMDTVDAMIYVTDMDTYEILLINKYVRETFGDIVGKRCWETLQVGQEMPCHFCETLKNSQLDPQQPDAIHVWQNLNSKNNEWYECRDKAVEWIDGRHVRLQVATHISDRKKHEQEREKLIKELRTALDEIKLLQGILPICSYCKNIRNDEGYYEQIEAYIHKHTGVDFSHTICDQCMKKHFPDLCDDLDDELDE